MCTDESCTRIRNMHKACKQARDTFNFMFVVYNKTAWKSLSVALFLDWQRKPGVLGSITAGQQGMYSNVCSSIPACNSMTRQPVPFPVPSPNKKQKKNIMISRCTYFLLPGC